MSFKFGFLDISEIGDEVLKNHYPLMSDTRKSETLALASDLKKRQKIAADLLCRKMISESCAIKAESIVFGKTENGKPYAENCDIRFSLSHCGSLVVCAVSEKEIGVDIEKIRDIRLKAAEKFACKPELEYIGNNTKRFFEIWTLKEAFFKCKGTGLGSDIKAVSFEIVNDEITCSEKGYKLFFNNIDGCVCSVCIKH